MNCEVIELLHLPVKSKRETESSWVSYTHVKFKSAYISLR